jgi:hypothetical protein
MNGDGAGCGEVGRDSYIDISTSWGSWNRVRCRAGARSGGTWDDSASKSINGAFGGQGTSENRRSKVFRRGGSCGSARRLGAVKGGVCVNDGSGSFSLLDGKRGQRKKGLRWDEAAGNAVVQRR